MLEKIFDPEMWRVFIWKSLERPILSALRHCIVPRIGIITSRKIGNAVTGNQIRRVVREALRFNLKYFKQSHDYLFISLQGIGTKSNKEIINAILNAIESLEYHRSYNLRFVWMEPLRDLLDYLSYSLNVMSPSSFSPETQTYFNWS
jgi:ribonuclease P protein component